MFVGENDGETPHIKWHGCGTAVAQEENCSKSSGRARGPVPAPPTTARALGRQARGARCRAAGGHVGDLMEHHSWRPVAEKDTGSISKNQKNSHRMVTSGHQHASASSAIVVLGLCGTGLISMWEYNDTTACSLLHIAGDGENWYLNAKRVARGSQKAHKTPPREISTPNACSWHVSLLWACLSGVLKN